MDQTTSHRWTECPDWFQIDDVAPGVQRIVEKHYRDDYRCNIYLVKGAHFDLVLDSGLGLGSLRTFLRQFSPDPVLIASHSHYDHIGSNFEFPRRLMHPAEADIAAAPTHENTLADLLLDTNDFAVLPWTEFRAEDWVIEPAAPTSFIQDGDRIDLGNRSFEVLHTPGHSWGGICLWDSNAQLLYSADTVYAGELFDQLPCSDIPTYVETMKRLARLPVQLALPCHGPVLSGDEFRAIVRGYIERNSPC